MPGEKHLRAVSAKGQHEYQHIKESAERLGRCGRRAKEVAGAKMGISSVVDTVGALLREETYFPH